MADRVERLTNLLALLLETPEPLSLVQIADELSGHYPDSKTARQRAAIGIVGIDRNVQWRADFDGQVTNLCETGLLWAMWARDGSYPPVKRRFSLVTARGGGRVGRDCLQNIP